MDNNTKHKKGDRIVTKVRLVREVNCDKCHNFYFEGWFRVYATDTHYYKGNFVVWFDTADLAEHFDKERFTKKDIREYAGELAYSFLAQAPYKRVTAETMRPFYEECRNTIERYNDANIWAA